MTVDGDLYTWGRGLYGCLGNASNKYELSPWLQDELKSLKDAEPEAKVISKIDIADEYTGVIMKDGSFYAWGKNDRGQLGVGSGIGIDMIESESMPVNIPVIDNDN